MINPILLNMLIRQVQNGTIDIEDIKDEEYKQAVRDRLDIN